MAYLLFPNRGKYELPDVVFDLMGLTDVLVAAR